MYLSGQSVLPWARYTWLGPGHTLACDIAATEGFPALALVPAAGSTRPCPLPPAWGDPVSLLWMVPLRPAELATLRERGLAALPALPLPRR